MARRGSRRSLGGSPEPAERPVRVRILGAFEVEDLDYVGSRKARTLLKILSIARGQPVSTDRLALCLWGDLLPANANKEISVLVSRLRAALGTDRITHSDAGYRFRPDWLDFTEAIELTQSASEAMLADEHERALGIATSAIALFRGQLLADEPEADWAEPHRLIASRLAAQLRALAGQAALRLGEVSRAAEFAEAQLEADRYDEGALRLLLAARGAEGRQAAAIAAYSRFRAILRDELGTEPGAETQQAHVALLKGEPVPGFVIGSRTAQPPREPSSRVAPLGELPGRTGEMEQLRQALLAASQGKVQMVGLTGDFGMGKTRLLNEFASVAMDEGALVLRASCHRWSQEGNMLPLADAFGEYLQTLSPEELGKIASSVPRLVLLGLPGWEAGIRTQDGQLEAGLMAYRDLTTLLERLASERVVVLAIDDLDLATPTSVDWMHYVARYAPRTTFLVVATWSSEARMPPGFSVVRLGPVDLAAAEMIVGAEKAARLHAYCGGNPGLMLRLAETEEGGGVPEIVLQNVRREVGELGAAAGTVKTAAVLGLQIKLRWLAPLLGLPVATLLDHLDLARTAGMLEERDSELEFKSEALREAIASMTPQAHREWVQQQVAANVRAADGFGRRATDRPRGAGAQPPVHTTRGRAAGARRIPSSTLR